MTFKWGSSSFTNVVGKHLKKELCAYTSFCGDVLADELSLRLCA